MKKILSWAIVLTFLVPCLSGAVFSADTVIMADPSTHVIKIDDRITEIPGYNINGNNYYKLRGIAQALGDAFKVDYENGVITITTGLGYVPDNADAKANPPGKAPAKVSAVKILIDGEEVQFDAYNIYDSNYFKLRDIAEAIDFGVSFDDDTVYIDSKAGYWPSGQTVPGDEIFAYYIDKLDGIGFVPYTSGQSAEDPLFTVSDEQIEERLTQIAPYVSSIRTFGCAGGLENIPRIAAEKFGLKVAVGLYISDDAASNARQIANAVKCAEYADMYLCGNESINLGFVSSEEILIKAINELRAQLKKAGYGDIPVGTNEVMSSYSDRLTDACDFFCFSYHPYSGGATAADAGKLWFPQQLNRAVEKAKGKPVIVGETGWPSFAKPGESKEKARREAAIYNMWAVYHAAKKQIKLFSFASHDEDWKVKYGPAEPAFGIFDKYGELKYREMFRGKFEDIDIGDIGDEIIPDCPGGENGEPVLTITEWPSEKNDFYVRGKVTGVNPADYRISAWIKVGGQWWAKPTWDDFVQFVALDGSFSIRLYSHTNDYYQTNAAVLLVKSSDEDKLDRYDYKASKKFAVLSEEK